MAEREATGVTLKMGTFLLCIVFLLAEISSFVSPTGKMGIFGLGGIVLAVSVYVKMLFEATDTETPETDDV